MRHIGLVIVLMLLAGCPRDVNDKLKDGIHSDDLIIGLIQPSATSPLISALADNDSVYRIPPSDALQGRLLAEKVWESGFTRVAVFSQDEPYGGGLLDTFRERYQMLGGTLAASAITPADKTSNFTAEINQLYAAGTPEALIIFAFDDRTSNLLREIITREGNLPPLFGVDGNLTSSMLANAPIQIAGMRGTLPGAALDRPQFLAFADRFQHITGVPVTNPNTGNPYDAVYLIALALAQAGVNTRAAVIDNLRAVSIADTPTPVVIGPGQIAEGFAAITSLADVDYQGVSNDIDFDMAGDPTSATYQYLEVVRSGNELSLQVIETIDYP